MKQQKCKFVYRRLSIILTISLCSTILLFSPQAIETGFYYDITPNWEWTPPHSHMNFLPGHTAPFPYRGISERGAQLLRAGMAFPDGLRIDENWHAVREPHGLARLRCTCGNMSLNGHMFRGFHGYHSVLRGGVWGRNNYVAAFSLITMIANAGGVVPAGVTHATVGLTPGAFTNIISRFRRYTDIAPAAAEGMRCGGCGTFMTWENIMEMNGLLAAYRAQDAQGQRSFRRHFIWGIALHALTDTFEHSVVVRDERTISQWYMMNNANNNKSLAPELSFAAAQAAAYYALSVVARPSGHAHRHGCYRVFLRVANPLPTTPHIDFDNPPSPQLNRFTGNFRMANLLDYAMENRAALIAANLNPA